MPKVDYDHTAYAVKNPGGFIEWDTLNVTKRVCIDNFLDLRCATKLWTDYWLRGYSVVRIGELHASPKRHRSATKSRRINK